MNQPETVDSNAQGAACRIIEVAETSASQVKVTSPIPLNYDPSNQWYEQVIAEIRHEFTNYQELLDELPICVDHRDAGGECVWDVERDLECPLAKQAHDIIKWAANRLAEAEYETWQKTRTAQRRSGHVP